MNQSGQGSAGKGPDADEARPESRSSVAPGAKPLAPHVLLQRFGRCAQGVIDHFVSGVGPSALVTEGKRLGTARIVRDGARIIIFAGDALERASDEQRALVPMVTDQFLSAASTALADADERQGSLDAGRRTVTTSKRSTAARAATLEGRAKARRKTMRAALVTAACGDGAWVTRIDTAAGKGSSSAELYSGLTGLVGVGRELRARLEEKGLEHRLTDDYFASAMTLAGQVRGAGAVLEVAGAAGAAGQGDVKRADGVCLWFLKRLVEAFDAAHEADPSIARPQVYSLRTVLRRTGRRKKAATPVTPPTPPAP